MKRRWILFTIMMITMLIPISVKADVEGYFENPEEIRSRFQKEIYDEDFEMEYGFLREAVPIYTDQYGSEYLAKAGKYTGVMAVSKTESYVQVIFQKKKDYAIGWMERSVYREQCMFYNGQEKQLLADGIYVMKSYSGDRFYYLELTFQGNQQYVIRSLKTDGYLDVVYDKKGKVQGLTWEKESEEDSQKWCLVREYDHFYLKNKATGQYLMKKNEKGMGLISFDADVINEFADKEKQQTDEKSWWTFERQYNKNVKPYRNFLQYDADWGKKDYGNVSDYSGKMAAAGCGAVVITNAIYALNGQFVDPMLMADLAVEKGYRMIGLGTDNGIFEAAAETYGDAYDFHFVKKSYNIFEVKRYLQKGCVAISHVPGHYVSIVDYKEKNEKYLVLDSHPIPARPTDPFGNWFKWNRLESGGLASQCYYIYSTMTKEERNNEFSE